MNTIWKKQSRILIAPLSVYIALFPFGKNGLFPIPMNMIFIDFLFLPFISYLLNLFVIRKLKLSVLTHSFIVSIGTFFIFSVFSPFFYDKGHASDVFYSSLSFAFIGLLALWKRLLLGFFSFYLLEYWWRSKKS